MAKSDLSNQRSERKVPPSPKVAPWLVTRHGKNCKFQTFYSLCDRKSYKKFISELSGKRFWQKNCHQGWLIIVDDNKYGPKVDTGDCYLWDPVSLKIIMLPNLQHFKELDGYRIKDCLLSSPPKSSSYGGGNGDGIEGGSSGDDAMVYILYDGGESPDILIYCHPGEKQWRKHEFLDKIGRLETMFYYRGKLYIMCMDLELLEITRQYGSISISELSTRNEIGLFKFERVGGSLGYCLQLYYMESFGEVFRIERYFIQRGDYAHSVTQIIISKLDFDSLTWEEVKILNDHVFFIDYYNYTRLSCLATELGLSRGYVYFTLKYDLSLYKYDQEDESILLSIPCPDIPTPWLAPKWMMIPTTLRVGTSRTTDLTLEKDEDLEKVTKAAEHGISSVDEDKEKNNFKEARLLTNFNEDMVWAVSNCLHRVDCIHLRAVSKKYRSVIDLRRYSSSRTVQTTDTSPWLFFPKHNPSTFNFIDPMYNNESYLLNIPELLKGARVRFSKGGWLLMSKSRTLFFYNPFTKSTVRLPDLPDFHGYNFTGISFSSLPTASDCSVFAIDKDLFRDQLLIFFIKRGEKDWSYNRYSGIYLPPSMKNMDFELTLNNPVFHHGRFYCLDQNGALGVFKHEQPSVSWEIQSLIAPPNCGFIYNSFLVECEGKLMSVLLGRLGNWVRVFRLNETKMVWVEVKHLGRHMLFLSSTSCISAVAPANQMENKIYFPRLHNGGILYYSLDTGMYHSVGSCHSAKDFRDSKEKLHCSWIEPDWSEMSDHYLDWLNI